MDRLFNIHHCPTIDLNEFDILYKFVSTDISAFCLKYAITSLKERNPYSCMNIVYIYNFEITFPNHVYIIMYESHLLFIKTNLKC